jgi:translation initiation factor IF-2
MTSAVKQLASRDKVDVRIFDVIYKLLDDARESMEKLLAPEIVETEIGALKIKGVFRTLKDEVIVGGEVTSGKVMPGVLVRVKRKKEQIAEMEVASVQRQQQEAKEVFEGEMCGINLKTNKKILLEEGDNLEFFTRELVKRTIK